MTTTHTQLRALALGLMIVAGLSGCASERYKAQAKREKELAAKEGYVWYTPVGSNIPILVPKDQAKPSERETEQTQEVFRDVQRGGVTTPGDPESQAANSGHPGAK